MRSAPGADLTLNWDAPHPDGWRWLGYGAEVPLSEESEAYIVRVRAGGNAVRSASVVAATFTYTASDQTADGVAGPFTLEVAQVSASFGPGLFATLDVAG